MRLNRFIACLGSVALFAFAGSRLHAAPITLGTGSFVQASTAEPFPTVTTTNNVTALPFSTPTSATSNGGMSTVNSDLSTSALSFTYLQFIPAGGFTDGIGEVHFIANAGVSYSLAGDLHVTGSDTLAELNVSLYDSDTQTYLYAYDSTVFTNLPGIAVAVGNLTLNATGGQLAGVLTAGDHYIFRAEESMTNLTDPTLNGTVALTFAQSTNPNGGSPVPLPTPIVGGAFALLTMAPLGALRRRVFKQSPRSPQG